MKITANHTIPYNAIPYLQKAQSRVITGEAAVGWLRYASFTLMLLVMGQYCSMYAT